LRVLADGEFYRVGGHAPIKVDVRIIAATHQNLEELVQAGKFREDLFHRLNVIRIHIPTLAERREDIPTLAQHFLARAAKEAAVGAGVVPPGSPELRAALHGPGNVTQRENSGRGIAGLACDREVWLDHLPAARLAPRRTAATDNHGEQSLPIRA